MLKIEYAREFKKDYKKHSRSRYKKTLDSTFEEIVSMLINQEALPKQYKDHELIGNWNGCRECHVRPDLLLVYRYRNKNILELVRLNSHSEIFK